MLPIWKQHVLVQDDLMDGDISSGCPAEHAKGGPINHFSPVCCDGSLWLILDLALESEGEIIWPVCLQELSGFSSLCSIKAGWECARRERGNVFDIRSAHTVGEAGTAGYD
ncbi:uncharacterized protein ACNS7B_009602 [Menidia menidia]